MTKENTKQFLNALNDKGVREVWNGKVACSKNKEETLEAAVEMAREMGYDVTAEDLTCTLEELRAEQMEKTQQAVHDMQELNDDALEEVVGGVYYYKYNNYSYIERKEGCLEDFTDTSCIFTNACMSKSVVYYGCPGKYYKEGEEYECYYNLWGNKPNE